MRLRWRVGRSLGSLAVAVWSGLLFSSGFRCKAVESSPHSSTPTFTVAVDRNPVGLCKFLLSVNIPQGFSWPLSFRNNDSVDFSPYKHRVWWDLCGVRSWKLVVWEWAASLDAAAIEIKMMYDQKLNLYNKGSKTTFTLLGDFAVSLVFQRAGGAWWFSWVL